MYVYMHTYTECIFEVTLTFRTEFLCIIRIVSKALCMIWQFPYISRNTLGFLRNFILV